MERSHRYISPRRRRRYDLEGLAYSIARHLHSASEPYLKRGEDPPNELLADTFNAACEASDATPLTEKEIRRLMVWVPKAIASLRRKIERADERLTASVKVYDDLRAAA